MNISIYLSRKSIVIFTLLLFFLFIGLIIEDYSTLRAIFGGEYQGLYLIIISYIIFNINIERVTKKTYLGYKSK